ncbi:HNH endonuclease signature motif containing protein [Microbacterium sp. MYb64]|uniref:HNH endonuclease signature motif containing protein n=1 Tax=Microbacterium sp. MYb64 TaxID=1848691 RepID=UPI000CFC84DF|nr:HNH endonuclease signature motif containing protein [Microbacterium sp. MYb64]PRB08369.1 HNH endonuclease [Microbacterium sp. MYb64]
MELFTDIEAQVQALRALLGDALEPIDLIPLIERLDDAQAVDALTAATALVQSGERIRAAVTGVIAARSSREAGQNGLAQSRGHRNVASLVQEITGSTRAEAGRQVRIGESLRTSAVAAASSVPAAGDQFSDDESTRAEKPVTPWHTELDRALLDGRITSAQHDAIRQGLADPPLSDETEHECEHEPECDETEHDALLRELWEVAADQLMAAAAHDTPEMLGSAARTIRDRLDPEGAARRFQERYSRRSFRVWTTADGHKRGAIDFDDEGYAWATTIIANAMRPRTGGPRFVDAEEKARAQALTDDPRTNDQLTYDLLLDLLRTGALADAPAVFGARRAGVRIVQVVNGDGIADPIAHAEDHLHSFPSAVAQQQTCDVGAVRVTVDSRGNPLDVGREHRLFTPKQRVALAIRDGGCRWTGCDRPASFGEAHHIDEWVRDDGRTDIDRGILLCRFHHMQLHHGGWRITRREKEDFVLHHPRGQTFALPSRPALRYAWAGVRPWRKRFRAAA